jgi:hypothetical protein
MVPYRQLEDLINVEALEDGSLTLYGSFVRYGELGGCQGLLLGLRSLVCAGGPSLDVFGLAVR